MRIKYKQQETLYWKSSWSFVRGNWVGKNKSLLKQHIGFSLSQCLSFSLKESDVNVDVMTSLIWDLIHLEIRVESKDGFWLVENWSRDSNTELSLAERAASINNKSEQEESHKLYPGLMIVNSQVNNSDAIFVLQHQESDQHFIATFCRFSQPIKT